MDTVTLAGCRPEPLASFLKAVGLLRLVGEQVDPAAAGRWVGDAFELRSPLDIDGLMDFLVHAYRPTPLVAPWNGGSGFHAKDNTSGLNAIVSSTDPRLEDYRVVIAAVRSLMSEPVWDLTEKDKAARVELCRSRLPDAALGWLDAAVVLTDAGARREFPPLLGTGGNVGRLEFSNNFMQRIADVLCLGTGRGATKPNESAAWARAALTGEPVRLRSLPIGQFDPAGAGGTNMAATGGKALANPWDYVLLLEGALLFASGAARRTGSDATGKAAMPFTFDPSPVGYGSASDGETAKGELWMPLWDRMTTFAELQRLIREARLSWGRARARSGLDAARAVATLGIDRGIHAFQRFSIVERLGQSMLAVPTGRIQVRERISDHVRRTHDLDPWVERVRRIPDKPATIASGLRRLERGLFELSLRPGPHGLSEVLVRAAELDAAIARSRAARSRVGPLQGLAAGEWVPLLPTDEEEVQLALAVASQAEAGGAITPASLLRRVSNGQGRLTWSERGALIDEHRPVIARLAGLLARRATAVNRSVSDEEDQPARRGIDLRWDWVATTASLPAVISLLRGDIVDTRLGELLAGAMLLDHRADLSASRRSAGSAADRASGSDSRSDGQVAALSLLAPFVSPTRRPSVRSKGGALPPLRADPAWPRLLMAGRVEEVLDDAIARLLLAGRRPLVTAGPAARSMDGVRLAAALAVPLSPAVTASLLARVAPLAPRREPRSGLTPQEVVG